MALRAGSVGPGLEAGRGAPARAGRAGAGLAEVGRRAPGRGRWCPRPSRVVRGPSAPAPLRPVRRVRFPPPRGAPPRVSRVARRPARSTSPDPPSRGAEGEGAAGRARARAPAVRTARVSAGRACPGGSGGAGPPATAASRGRGAPVRRRAGSRASGVGRARTGVGPASWTVLAARPPRCGRFGRHPTAGSELVRTRGIRLSN